MLKDFLAQHTAKCPIFGNHLAEMSYLGIVGHSIYVEAQLNWDRLEATMATVDKGGTVTLQELVVSSLAHTDAVAKLLC